MTAWWRPKYQYTQTTTLWSCVRAFLDANGWRKEDLANDIGCGIDQIERWLANEYTVGLTTKYKRRFEEVTGIDLERLYVIRAKNEILHMLDDINETRIRTPLLARLLERDKNLREKIDFNTSTTRNEIIRALREEAKRCGYSLVALQIGVDDRQVSKWDESGSYRPSDEYLVRAIVGLSSGFVEGDPDNVRFMILAEAILGRTPAEIGIDSFREALDVLFDGTREDAQSVISNRTGLHRSVVHSLLRYEPTGKITAATMVQVLRAIVRQRYGDGVLDVFDNAAKEALRSFGENKSGNRQIVVTRPVLILNEPLANTQPQAAATKVEPKPKPKADQPPQNETGVVVVWLLSQIVELLKAVCNLDADQRDAILRASDPHLVEMRHLFDAAGLEQPAEYLKLVSQDRAAGSVLS